jgi:hypothetical protein
MALQLIAGILLASLTVFIHAVGALRVVIPLARMWRRGGAARPRHSPTSTLVRLVNGLLILHLIEMALWAAVFIAAGVFSSFETSLYFSLTSYTTVGYGDVLPPQSWRLLGPIEAAVGVLLLGVSTGVLVTAVTRIYADLLEDDHRSS